jgi:hypothetical protein
LAALVVALALAAPPAALAQTATQDGYGTDAGTVQTQVDDGSTGSAAVTRDGGGGSLPFTGLDLALLACAGVLLVGAGICLQRLTRVSDRGHS